MPTAAKLFGAIAFALVAFFAAETYKPSMPPDTVFGFFSLVAALVGVVVGWASVGPRTGNGYYRSAGAGLRGSFEIVFLMLFVYGLREMLLRATSRRYRDVVEALEGMMQVIVDYLLSLAQPEPMLVLVIGGALGGMLSEWAAKRWR